MIAIAINLATAWIEILPETSKIGPGIKKALGDVTPAAEDTGKSLGSKIAGGLGSVMKGGGVAAGAVLAAGLVAGVGRLTAIDDAKGKLKGLGHDAGSVSAIMDSALNSVKGTSFGLGDAATVAASAVAAGIKPGQDLTKNLSLVADAASIAGVDMDSMGSIFNKVATTGKVSGDVLNQLGEAGIPIIQLLAEQMGVASGDVAKLASAGKIGFADFQAAMDKGLGGAAQEAGNTVSGSFDNMKAALGRMGAVIAGPLFEAAPKIIGAITEGFDKFGKIAEPVAKSVGEGIEKIMAWLGGLGGIDVFGSVIDGIQTFVSAFLSGSEDVEQSGLPGFFQQLGVYARDIFDVLKPVVTTIGEIGVGAIPIVVGAFGFLFDVLGKVADAFSKTINFFKENKELAAAVGAVLTGLLLPPLLIAAGTWVANTVAMAAYNAIGTALNVATKIWTAGQWLLNAALTGNPIGVVIALIVALIAGIVLAYRNSETFRDIIQKAWEGIQAAISFAWNSVIKPLVTQFIEGFKQIGDFALWLWNSAIKPAFDFIAEAGKILALVIGTIVVLPIMLAFKALSAAISFAWNSVIKPAFDLFAAGAQWLWTNALQPVFAWIQAGFSAVGTFFGWVWNSLIRPAWDAISMGIKLYWETVVRPVFDALKTALGAVGDFFKWVWDSVIKPAWSALGDGIKWVWENVIKPNWEALKTALGAIGDFFTWVWEKVIQPVWEALGKGITWVWEKVISPAFDALKTGLGKVGDFFTQIVNAIQSTWDRIKEIVRVPIEFLVNTIYNKGIVPAWNAVAGFIGLEDKRLDTIPGFNRGGIYPGYTPGRDTGVIAVGGGEAIMRPEWTQAVGPGYVDAANSAARGGGINGVRKFLGAFANGGIIDSMKRIVDMKFPGMSLTSALRFSDSGYHSKGQAADFSDGGDAGTPAMKALAGYIADNYAPDTIQLIHSPFDRNIGDNQFVGDGMDFYGAGTMAQHRNHVHWAISRVLGEPSGGSIMSAIGGAIGSAVNWLRNKAADLFEKPVRAIGKTIPDFGGAPWAQTARGIYDRIADSSIAFVRGRADEKGGSMPGEPGGGAEQWRAMATEALLRTGFNPPERYIENMLKQIQTESGGNPGIVQTVRDVNSGGNEAQGLLQVIPGTFAAYRDPTLPNDRTDPMANMVAALNYMKGRYGGDINGVWGKGNGYDSGGLFEPNTLGWNTSGATEAVLTNPEWKLFQDFNDILAEIGPEFMAKMSEITSKAGLEILGLDGTLLDPDSNRYFKAGQEIAKTAAEFQAKRDADAAEVVEESTVNNDYSINIVNPVFQDQNAALQTAGAMQQRSIMRNAGRPF